MKKKKVKDFVIGFALGFIGLVFFIMFGVFLAWCGENHPAYFLATVILFIPTWIGICWAKSHE